MVRGGGDWRKGRVKEPSHSIEMQPRLRENTHCRSDDNINPEGVGGGKGHFIMIL